MPDLSPAEELEMRARTIKLMADMKDNWTMVPVMRNLHAFDWVCGGCLRREYQGKIGRAHV